MGGLENTVLVVNDPDLFFLEGFSSYCFPKQTVFFIGGLGRGTYLGTNNQCLKTAKVEVFNRYGNKVFEDADYTNQWDGTYKGKPLPDGTYYYVVTYTLVNGKPTYIKGNVTILR